MERHQQVSVGKLAWPPAGARRGASGPTGARRASGTPALAITVAHVCPVDDATEPLIVGVVVAPDGVPADHAGLFLVAGVAGAVEREVPQRGELRPQCGLTRKNSSACRRSRRCSPSPGPQPGVFGRGKVRAEVVADHRDPGGCRVEGAQVPAELQEPGPGLERLDVPVQFVLAQLAGGGQVPGPGGAGAGRAPPGPRRPAGSLPLPLTAARCRPGRGCRFSGPNSSTRNTTSGSPSCRAASRSAIVYRCSGPRLLSAYCGSFEAVQASGAER